MFDWLDELGVETINDIPAKELMKEIMDYQPQRLDLKNNNDDELDAYIIGCEARIRRMRNIVETLLCQIEKECDETPWYHNTANCVLEGKKDELRDIQKKINLHADGDIFCYISGRREALNELHNELSRKLLNIDKENQGE